jgi:hypothetical protein
VWIAFHLKVSVLWAGLGLAPREGEVDLLAFEDEHTESASHGIESEMWTQRGFQRVDLQSVDFHVDIFGRALKQGITHTSTDEECAAAPLLEECGDLAYGRLFG